MDNLEQKVSEVAVSMNTKEGIELTKLLMNVEVVRQKLQEAEAKANEQGQILVEKYKPSADASLKSIDMDEGRLVFNVPETTGG